MSDDALMFSRAMGCGESWHETSAAQHHRHSHEVKTTVMTRCRDRRTRIVKDNNLTHNISVYTHLKYSLRPGSL